MSQKTCIQKQTKNINAGDVRDIQTNPPANMTPKEYAAYVVVSERTARDHFSKGIIPYIRLGGKIIIRLKDLDQKLDDLVIR